MGASPLLRDIFRARKERWGDDDDGFTFERPDERLDVFVYRSNDEIPMTTFATVGMAARTLPGTDERAELHLARRGRVSPEEENAIAVQPANLASHPWENDTSFAWGHLVGLQREFPTFFGCHAVFLGGPFVEGGWDVIDTAEGSVRILNVVPITEAERIHARHMTPTAFLSALMAGTDIFIGRPSA